MPDLRRQEIITVYLLPAPSKPDFPLDVDRCARWLWDGRAPRLQASHLGVIRRVAELGGEQVVFMSDGRLYTAAKILELIDENGKLRTSEDPRPVYDTRLQEPKND